MNGRKQEFFLTFVIGFYLLCNMPWGSLLRTKIIVLEEVKVGESFRYNGISLMCEHAPDATCKGCFFETSDPMVCAELVPNCVGRMRKDRQHVRYRQSG